MQTDGSFVYPTTLAAFNLLVDGNDYGWAADQNFPVGNEPGGFDDTEAIYIGLVDGSIVYSAESVDLLYWNREHQELRYITDYTQPPLRLVYEDGVVPTDVLEEYRGAFERSDFPTPDATFFDPGEGRGDWVYNIDDARIWYSTVSGGVFGWQRSSQDLIHVTVFPTDIALWVGGNVGNSGANNINAGAFANAQALIDDLEANNGEFGPTDEDFDDTKPLIYYNEALGSLRAITRVETRSTLVTVFTESAVPAGVLEAEGYIGDFANSSAAPDATTQVANDFFYGRNDGRFFHNVSTFWSTTNQGASFDNYFPINLYLWVGGNVGNTANYFGQQGAYANEAAILAELEDGMFGLNNDEPFGVGSLPLLYWNTALSSLRIVTATQEEVIELPDDVIEEFRFRENTFPTSSFSGNFRGFVTSGLPSAPNAIGDWYFSTTDNEFGRWSGTAWTILQNATDVGLILDTDSYNLASSNADGDGINSYADSDAVLAGLRSGDVTYVHGESTIYYNQADGTFNEITFYGARLEDTITTIPATATHLGANFQGVFANVAAFTDPATLDENDYVYSLSNNRLYAVAGTGWIIIASSVNLNLAFPSGSYTWFGGNNQAGNIADATALALHYAHGDGTYNTALPTIFYNDATSQLEVVTRLESVTPGTLQSVDDFSRGVQFVESNLGDASGRGVEAVWIPEEGTDTEVANYIDANITFDEDLYYFFEDADADSIKEVDTFTAQADEYQRAIYDQVSFGGTVTESQIRMILGFTAAEQADTFTDASIAGRTITFDQEDGGTVDVVLPTDVNATGVTLSGSTLTIARAGAPSITVDLSTLAAPDDFVYVLPSEVTRSGQAYTLTPAIPLTSLTVGVQVAFEAEAANTGSLTANISGLGAEDILRSDGTDIESGDVPNGKLIIFTITNSGEFISNINPPFAMSESDIRTLLSLTQAQQDGLVSALSIATNVITITRLNGTTFTLTLPTGGGADPTESQIRTALGFSAAEQAATFNGATYDAANSRIVFQQEAGSEVNVVLPVDVDNYVDDVSLNAATGMLTIERTGTLVDIVIDLSSIITDDDSIHITPTGVVQTANDIALTSGESITSYDQGLEIIFEAEVTNTGNVTVNVDAVGNRSLRRKDGAHIAAGELPDGLIIRAVFHNNRFRSDIEPSQVTEDAVRAILGLTEADQDEIVADIAITTNILTVTRLDGATFTLTLPAQSGDPTETQIRTALGFTSAEQMATFINATYNTSTGAIDFEQEDGTTHSVVLPTTVDEYISGAVLNSNTAELTLSFADSLADIVIDLSTVIPIDDSIHIPASGLVQTPNSVTLTSGENVPSYNQGLEIIFESEASNTGPASVNLDGLGSRFLRRKDGTHLSLGDLPVGLFVRAVYHGLDFISDIEQSPVTEDAVRTVLSLTDTQQDSILVDLALATNILTVTKLDGTTSTITLPSTGAADPTETQVRTALGFTSAEQMATFINAVYNTATGAIDFTQEDGSTHSVVLPTTVDEHLSGAVLNSNTMQLTLSFADSLGDIVIDLSTIIPIDDSVYIPPSGVTQVGNSITLTSVETIASYDQGLEIIFESEVSTTGATTVTLDGLGVRFLRRKDGTQLQSGDLPVGLFVRAVYHGSDFISDIEPSQVTEAAVRSVLGLTASDQNEIVTDLALATNILTVTRLDGTTYTITLPAQAGDPTETQIRTALGFTSAEQMATFIDAVYNTGTGAIDFTQEDGTVVSISIPTAVDEHLSGAVLDATTMELTLSFAESLADIVIDLSTIIPIDDSIHIPPINVTQVGNVITLTSAEVLTAYFTGLEIIFEAEAVNTGNVTVNLDGIGSRQLRRKDGAQIAAGELPDDLFIRAVFHGNRFRSDIEPAQVTEVAVRAVLSLTELQQNGLIASLSIAANIITVTKLDGTTSELTLPAAGTPTEDQIRLALGFTSAEQMATFIDAVYNTVTGAIDFTQEDGTVVSVAIPSAVDEHLSGAVLNATTSELTLSFADSLADIVIDLSTVIPIDDSIHIPASGVIQTANAIFLTSGQSLAAHQVGLEIIFEAEVTNTGNVDIILDGLATISLRRKDGSNIGPGELPDGLLIRAVYHGNQFVSDIERSPVTENAVRGVLGLTETEQDGIVTSVSLGFNILTITKLDGTSSTITLPGGTPNESQIRTALGLTSAEQMATFIGATYNSGTGAIDFEQEDGSTHSVVLPTSVDEYLDGVTFNANNGRITFSFADSQADIVLDISSIVPEDDSVYFLPTEIQQGSLGSVIATPAETLSAYFVGLEIIFETENTNSTTNVNINISSLGNRALLKSDGSAFAADELPNGRLIKAVYHGTSFISNVDPIRFTKTALYNFVREMVAAGQHTTINLDPVNEIISIIGEPAEVNETLSGEFQRAETVRMRATPNINGLIKGSALQAVITNPIDVLYGSSAAQIIAVINTVDSPDRIQIRKKGIYSIDFHGGIFAVDARVSPRFEIFNFDDDENTATAIGRTTTEYIRYAGDNQEVSLDGHMWIAEDNTDIKIIPSNEHVPPGQSPTFQLDPDGIFTLLRTSETGVPIERLEEEDRLTAEDAHPNYLYIDVSDDDEIEGVKIRNKVDDNSFTITPVSFGTGTGRIGYASEALTGVSGVAAGTIGSNKIAFLWEENIGLRVNVAIKDADLGVFADNFYIYLEAEDGRVVYLTPSASSFTGFTLFQGPLLISGPMLTEDTESSLSLYASNGTPLETSPTKKSVYTNIDLKGINTDERILYSHKDFDSDRNILTPSNIYGDTLDTNVAGSRRNLYQDRKFQIGRIIYSSKNNGPVNWMDISSGTRTLIDAHAGEAVTDDLIYGTVFKPDKGWYQVTAEILAETDVEFALDMALYQAGFSTDPANLISLISTVSARGHHRFSSMKESVHGVFRSRIFDANGDTDRFYLLFGLNEDLDTKLTDNDEGLYVWRGAQWSIEWKRIRE